VRRRGYRPTRPVGRRGSLTTSRPSSSSTALDAPLPSSTVPEDHSTGRCPRRAIRRQLTAELDQLPQLVQEAGAVVSQVVGDELAWKLALRRRRSGPMTRSNIHSPPRCGKAVDNFGCRTAGARWAFERAVRRPYDARPGLKSLERVRCGKNLGKSANFCQPFPNVDLRLAVRTRPPCV
jgi:hypothetical protein